VAGGRTRRHPRVSVSRSVFPITTAEDELYFGTARRATASATSTASARRSARRTRRRPTCSSSSCSRMPRS
jgi:hypothetical protein